ncbi:MAG: SIS domain-containing protein [Clostridia bacterium]|nr:SIS domain-containing protein [Clostridia bacterium]
MNQLLSHYPELASCREALEQAVDCIVKTYQQKGKVLLCGNGGSSSDCEHIAGELLKSFLFNRTVRDESIPEDLRSGLQGSLPAIPLPSIMAAFTATLNDMDPAMVYAQLLYGLGTKGDLLIAISTSGNAENVLRAAKLARAMGITVLALTGENGGALASVADLTIRVPAKETYRVQEYHLPVYHYLCATVEKRIFGTEA